MRMFLLAALLGGIALAQTPEAPPEKVKVYVYPAPSSSGLFFKVYSDQTVIAFIGKKYYVTADLEPGRHLIYADTNAKYGITANLAVGREYFLQCADSSVAHAKMWIGRTTTACTIVDPEQGKSDIEKLTQKQVVSPKELRKKRND